MQATEAKKVEISLANYRLAFDAMRAYHTSEIEHKKDMISILNQVLLSIITVFAGVFYFILSNGYDNYKEIAMVVIVIISSVYCWLIWKLNDACITKIEADNQRYEQFKNECILERNNLAISSYCNKAENIYWNKAADPAPSKYKQGFRHTIGIISVYSRLLIFIIMMLTIISVAVLLDQVCRA